jgi:hypothetical protein
VTLTYPVPLSFFCFQADCFSPDAEANVEQVFSRAGQFSEVNSDPEVWKNKSTQVLFKFFEYKGA